MNIVGIDQLIKHNDLFWMEIRAEKLLNKLFKSFQYIKKLTSCFIENASPKSKTKEMAYFV
jgi:hypothetical protein